MRKLFYEIRKLEVINLIIRTFLIRLDSLIQKSKLYWRISGTIDLTYNGIKFKYFSSTDDGIVDTLFYKLDHREDGELKLIQSIISNGTFIIDIGANTGLYSLLAAKTNPSSKILAIEPHPGNFKRLSKNIKLNNLTNVSLLQNAVGDLENEIIFNIPQGVEISDTSSADLNFSKQTYEGSLKWKEIKVQQITLDSLITKIETKEVNAIKIDVEGYEINVFEGAKQFFKEFYPIVICEIFLTENKKEYFDQYIKDLNLYAYLCLKDGIIRLDDGLIYNHDGLNFIFAKGKTKNTYNSYQTLDSWMEELYGNKKSK